MLSHLQGNASLLARVAEGGPRPEGESSLLGAHTVEARVMVMGGVRAGPGKSARFGKVSHGIGIVTLNAIRM